MTSIEENEIINLINVIRNQIDDLQADVIQSEEGQQAIAEWNRILLSILQQMSEAKELRKETDTKTL